MLTTDEPCDRMKVLTINYNRVVRRCLPGEEGLTALFPAALYQTVQTNQLRGCSPLIVLGMV